MFSRFDIFPYVILIKAERIRRIRTIKFSNFIRYYKINF